MWCFKAMSVFQKSTCKSWQNCLRIWNQSRACNWFWCLSTRSASKWGQEAHVNTHNATKIFSAQVLPATHTAFIRCYTTHVSTLWLHVCVSAHACVGIAMQMSGSAPRTWLVVCITDASASLVLCLSLYSLALHSQLLAYPTCMQDTLKYIIYLTCLVRWKSAVLSAQLIIKKKSRNPENRRRINKPLPTESFCLHSHPAHGGKRGRDMKIDIS